MPQPHDSAPDDQQLVLYLLGLLPDEETERLDEATVVDDQMAARLRIVEHDLIDGYVRGTLASDVAERFESYYLSTPRRRAQVSFARNFLGAIDRADQQAGAAAARAQSPGLVQDRSFIRLVSRSSRAWPLIAGAASVLIVTGAVWFQQGRVATVRELAREERLAFDRRNRGLQTQLEEQRAANAEVAKQLASARSALEAQQASGGRRPETTSAPAFTATALVLWPETRGIGGMPSLRVAPETGYVGFELRLESSDSARYQVSLKDPATSRILWRSGSVATVSRTDGATVSINVPATLLKPQHYSLELAAVSGGPTEVVSSYTFQIVR